jgi:hypothetical protein
MVIAQQKLASGFLHSCPTEGTQGGLHVAASVCSSGVGLVWLVTITFNMEVMVCCLSNDS